MQLLNQEQADAFLRRIDLEIGAWNQVSELDEPPLGQLTWINYACPEGALALYCFSHHILRWLTPGCRMLLQIDNSTTLSADEGYLISRLLLGPEKELLDDSRSVLFEILGDVAQREELLLGSVLYLLILFGHHCQIVSDGGREAQHLSIQDGYVYFSSKVPAELDRARKLMEELIASPFPSPHRIWSDCKEE